MSTLLVDAIQDSDGAGPKATLPASGGSNFTLGPNWGVWEFVSTTAITVVSELDTTVASGYDYLLSLTHAVPVTDNVELQAKFGQSGIISANYTDAAATGQTEITLAPNVGFVATEGLSAELLVPDPGAAGTQKHILSLCDMYTFTDGTINASGKLAGAYTANTNAIDTVRLLFSSGNFQAIGTLRVWRRRIS